MAKFFAMVKKIGEEKGRGITFEAEDTIGPAIRQMELMSGLKTTDMVGFELMKIVENGDAYIPYAAKRERERRPINTAEQLAATTANVRKDYTPYKCSTA